MLKEKELCYRITGCVYEVYRHLGAGFLESVYQKALIQELQLINYLKATGKELGLLVNFSFPKAVIKRVVL
ncbi:GxxExxY protein [Marinobacter subterrani]|uniref:GxxExxY protein n=1 Tax=Marinobacter subterrani TaxID=1658765 RepID=UPI0023562E36|nr:GxxExxY protein [Marinobacter subterrani]